MIKSTVNHNNKIRPGSADKIITASKSKRSFQKPCVINTHRLIDKKTESQHNVCIEEMKTTRIPATKNTQNQRNKNLVPQNQSSQPKLKCLPRLQNGDQIDTLNYSMNKISIIPKDFAQQYVNLKNLNLSNNQIIQIQPLCYFKKLVQLNLSFNLINQIPKEIKKLARLEFLDLSHNKLWYLTQIVSIKDLVSLRNKQLKQTIEISLQGNSILRTNSKAVEKIISCKKTFINNKKNALRSLIAQIGENKQNLPSNSPQILSSISQEQNLCKPVKTKSLNQSLFDISAIFANIPFGVQNKQEFKGISLAQKCQNKLILDQQRSDSLKPSKQVVYKLSQTDQAPQTLIFDPENFPSIQAKQFENKASQSSIRLQFLKKIDNFQDQYAQPCKKLYKQITQIQKKLKLIETIKQIPNTFSLQFFSLNQDIFTKINTIKEFLKPFLNFIEQSILQKFNFLQINLQIFREEKGLELKILRFQQKVIGLFLNSQKLYEIKWFEVWIYQFQILRAKLYQSQIILNSFILVWKKIQKIGKIISLPNLNNFKHIFPNKKNVQSNEKHTFSSKKTSQKKQLKNLLFSQNKCQKTQLLYSQMKQSLLLSSKQSKANSNIDLDQKLHNFKLYSNNCMQCPIKNQQTIILSQRIQQYERNIKILEIKVEELQKTIKCLEQAAQFNEKIKNQQSSIVEHLKQIKPSTYQNILFTQAISIQNFIDDQNKYIQQKKIRKNEMQIFSNQKQRLSQINDENIRNGSNSLMKFKHQTDHICKASILKMSSNKILKHQNQDCFFKNKPQQTSERTYFKSNGVTDKFSNSIQINKNSRLKGNYQIFTLPSNKKVSLKQSYSVGKYNSNTTEQKVFESKQMEPKQVQKQLKQKNNLFNKIVVRQFFEEKIDNNNIGQQIINKNKNQKFSDRLKQNQKLKKQQDQNLNRINQIQAAIEKKKNNCRDLSKRKLNCLKDTYSSQQFDKIDLHSSNAYDYTILEFQERIKYKNYIKFHLRNNIKQVLQKRNFDISKKRSKTLTFSGEISKKIAKKENSSKYINLLRKQHSGIAKNTTKSFKMLSVHKELQTQSIQNETMKIDGK